MITEQELDKLADFGKVKDGSYCDGWQFSIVPKNHKRTMWDFYLFNELNGDLTFIKQLEDITDLEEIYYMLSEPKQELEYIK